MMPIEEILARIRWDPAYAAARFEIAYLDHDQADLVRVPIGPAELGEHPAQSVQVAGPDGVIHAIPPHRIKAVYRDGALIWERTH